MSTRKRATKKPTSILHRDIKDLEIGKSLRRLGNIRVTEWELGDVLPAVGRLAKKEVDVVGAIKRTANYRVTEWDLKDLLRRRRDSGSRPEPPTPQVMLVLEQRLMRFVVFVASRLIDRPGEVVLTARRPTPGFLAIQMVLERRDAAALIGHGGHTAAAIRGICRDVAAKQGARMALQIMSQEEARQE